MDEATKIFEECDKIMDECNSLIDEEIAIKNKLVKSDADHLRLAEIQTRKSELIAKCNSIMNMDIMHKAKTFFNGDVINEVVF